MPTDLIFPRLYADLSGGSRFDSVSIPVTLQNFAHLLGVQCFTAHTRHASWILAFACRLDW